MLKIRLIPPPEPCRGLREKTETTPPVAGKTPPVGGNTVLEVGIKLLDLTGGKAIGRAVLLLFNFPVRPSKNPYHSNGTAVCV